MSIVTVTPIYKAELSDNELLSVSQLIRIVDNHPHVFVAPKELDISYYQKKFGNQFSFEFFDSKYFKSPQSYNTLLRNIDFFERFGKYSHLLMYHTDAWIFNDNLEEWVRKNYSYVGAPIYEYNGTRKGGHYICSGQGGFSLHHIASAIKVLKSKTVVYPLSELNRWYKLYNWKGRLRFAPYYVASVLGKHRLSTSGNNNVRINEDIWWGKYVADAFDWYTVPEEAEAAKFSMEFNCDFLLANNRGQTPMGTHQWYKPLFIDFWSKHINK